MNEDKLKLIYKLQQAEEIYVLMSKYTRMPYVVCDEETYDDEVLLFFESEAAEKEAERLTEAGDPVGVVVVEQKLFLQFYTSLFPMGVNCLRVNKGTDEEATVQHSELITREDPNKVKEGNVRIENPELHLTALYFTQEFCKKREETLSEDLAEVYEELLAHFGKGLYIVGAEEEKGIPMLKKKDGKAFLPIFTDFYEFGKFNKDGNMKVGIANAEKVSELLTEEMSGIVINPFGVNMILTMTK